MTFNAPQRSFRFQATLLLSAALVFGLGWTRPSEPLDHERFWVSKISQEPSFDLVVAGNSRVYRGVSPQAMKETLPDARILNFGFSACGFGPSYLEATAALLDPQSADPVLVLGITPGTLTRLSQENNHFLELSRLTWLQRFEVVHLGAARQFLRPSALVRPAAEVDPAYRQVFHPDGWVASRRVPEDPRAGLAVYRQRSKGDPDERVQPELIQGLSQAVRDWTQRGIRVFAFRFPATSAMDQLQDELTGFDEPAVSRLLEESGAVWLQFPDTYASYDGSHLRDDAAQRFSRDLALAIRTAR